MAKKILLFAFFVFLTGCAGSKGSPTYPVSLTPEINKDWEHAERLVEQGRYKEADLAYDNFIEVHGYNSLTDRAYFKRGEISFLDKRYEDAIFYYRKACSGVYSPAIAPKSQFKAAYSLYLLKRFNEAEKEIEGIHRSDASVPLRVRMDSLGVNISKSGGWGDEGAIAWYLFLLDDYIDLSGRNGELDGYGDIVSEDEALLAVRKWVEDDSVGSNQVRKLPLKGYGGKRSGGYAFFKLGKALNKEGDFNKATKELKAYSYTYPKHEYYDEAKYLLGESSGRAGEVSKVGLILPLSGKFLVYGESVLRGAECAVGVFEPCRKGVDIQLIVRDSEGDKDKAVEAVNDLAKEGVVAIIGAILSTTANDIAQKSQELGVPLITLSQREGLPQVGEYIFRNTVTASSQVDAITNYAVNNRDLKRFLVLYPKNKNGDEYRELFATSVSEKGGEIVAAYPYSSSRVEFSSELMSIPLKEYAQNKKFDAIFIPDSFNLVSYLVPTLETMGVKGFQYLGISRWNNPKLVAVGGQYLEGAVFPEAFYKDLSNLLIREFFTQFSGAYGIEPTLLEALSYDSMRMVISSLERGVERRSLRDALAGVSGFGGVTGVISFNEKRDAQRTLPLLTVSGGQIIPLNTEKR